MDNVQQIKNKNIYSEIYIFLHSDALQTDRRTGLPNLKLEKLLFLKFIFYLKIYIYKLH